MKTDESLWWLLYERLKSLNRKPLKSDGMQLYNFYNRMKRMKNLGRLPEDKYELLKPYIEFRNELDIYWDKMYNEATNYFMENGNLFIQLRTGKLSGWIEAQRQMFSRGNYDADRKFKLDKIGMIWDFNDSYFDIMFKNAVDSILLYNRIPTRSENRSVRIWLDTMSLYYKKGALNKNRQIKIVELLDKIKRLRQTGRAVYLLHINKIKECHSSLLSILNKYSVNELGVSSYMLYKHDFTSPFSNRYIIIEYFILQTVKEKAAR